MSLFQRRPFSLLLPLLLLCIDGEPSQALALLMRLVSCLSELGHSRSLLAASKLGWEAHKHFRRVFFFGTIPWHRALGSKNQGEHTSIENGTNDGPA